MSCLVYPSATKSILSLLAIWLQTQKHTSPMGSNPLRDNGPLASMIVGMTPLIVMSNVFLSIEFGINHYMPASTCFLFVDLNIEIYLFPFFAFLDLLFCIFIFVSFFPFYFYFYCHLSWFGVANISELVFGTVEIQG